MKPNPFQIELATLADIPQLSELLTLLFTQEDEFNPNPAKQERALRLILEQPEQGSIFVVKHGNGLGGMASVLFNISTAEGGIVATLEDFIVRPELRGQGIGQALFQHALAAARAKGCTRVTLLTDLTNEKAIRFYERSGFSKSDMITLRLSL